MKLMGYRSVEQPSNCSELAYAVQTAVLTATCTRKLSRGALAVGYSIESDTDYCVVKIRDGRDSVKSRRSQTVSRTVRHVQRLVVKC